MSIPKQSAQNGGFSPRGTYEKNNSKAPLSPRPCPDLHGQPKNRNIFQRNRKRPLLLLLILAASTTPLCGSLVSCQSVLASQGVGRTLPIAVSHILAEFSLGSIAPYQALAPLSRQIFWKSYLCILPHRNCRRKLPTEDPRL